MLRRLNAPYGAWCFLAWFAVSREYDREDASKCTLWRLVLSNPGFCTWVWSIDDSSQCTLWRLVLSGSQNADALQKLAGGS